MAGSLQQINIDNFTGGLNLRANQFQLDPSETPDMLNMEVDPRGGFFTRKGWGLVNSGDITADDWDPRSAARVSLTSDASQMFIANDDKVLASTDGGVSWDDMGIVATASPHLADFAAWGDRTYIVTGPDNPSIRQDGLFVDGVNDPAALTNVGPVTFNDDYTVPGGGIMPQAECIAVHSGYVFVGNTFENTDGGSASFPNRIRWSHPLQPEDFAEQDYIDIDDGGSQITALVSFDDHLVIFKTDSIWYLYGYELDSFQLVRGTNQIGTPHPGCVTKSESSVFFYSPADRGGIWGYNGTPSPVSISAQLETMFEEFSNVNDVWVAWSAKKLFVSVPWVGEQAAETTTRSLFAWDPTIGNGAWTRYRPSSGDVQLIVRRGDHLGEGALLVMKTPNLVRTEAIDAARDDVGLGVEPFRAYYRTGWRDAGWPERRKSWRRARFIMSDSLEAITVGVNTYSNYKKGFAVRSHTLVVEPGGENYFWRETGALEDGGFDWGDGAMWGRSQSSGSSIERVQPAGPGATGFGVSEAIQLEVIATDAAGGARWGVDAIVLKYRERRATT